MRFSINLLFCFTLFASVDSSAEVVIDGSVGAVTNLSGQMTIPQSLGATVGNNLFHSFKTFNINTGESAIFTGENSIKNVISRVTGTEISTINGLLKSEVGNANFYFINPNGVTFGANAQIDVPAAFHVSTADNLRFADGKVFSATHPSASSLTIAEPASFGFLGAANHQVLIDGAKLAVKTGEEFNVVAGNIGIKNSEIKAEAGSIRLSSIEKNISVVPINGVPDIANGVINIKNSIIDTKGNGGGKLNIQGGDISIVKNTTLWASNIGSRNADFDQGINIKCNNLVLKSGYISNTAYNSGNVGNIKINSDRILIDGQKSLSGVTSYANNLTIINPGNAGNISIKGDSLKLLNNAFIGSDTYSSGYAGSVDVDVKNILIDGFGSNTGIFSVSHNRTMVNSGNAGNVSIKGDSLNILHGGWIKSSSFGYGNSGDVKVEVKKVLIDGIGNMTGIINESNNRIASNINHGGYVSIKGDSLNILNNGWVKNIGFDYGNAGNIEIDVKKILIDGQGSQAGVFSNTNSIAITSSGNGGNVKIKGDSLKISDSGFISSDTYGSGNSGNVEINAKQIEIDGQGNKTGISSNAYDAGNSGNVKVQTDSLKISDSGFISSDTYGSGNSGNVEINAKQIDIDGQGNKTGISSNTYNAGNSGFVKLISSIFNINGSFFSEYNYYIPAGVYSDAYGNGNTAGVQLNTKALNIHNGGEISSSTYAGIGNSGGIKIDANDIVITAADIDVSKIAHGRFSGGIKSLSYEIIADQTHYYSKEFGKSGNIDISTNSLSILDGGAITSYSKSASYAGDVNIVADEILINGHRKDGFPSLIDAGVYAGQLSGGKININTGKLELSDGGGLTTMTASRANGGIIDVTAKSILLNGGGINAVSVKSENEQNINSGKGGNIILIAENINLNQGGIAVDTTYTGAAGSITLTASQTVTANNLSRISSTSSLSDGSASQSGSAGSISISAPIITLDNSSVFAEAQKDSNGQTGNISVIATKALELGNQSKVSIENNATIANSSGVKAGEIIVSAPDIDLKDSSITAASTGNVDSGNITVNFSHWLTMDPSFISTSAIDGNGGGITINGGELINLQNSGFLTSVTGANGNGGNINVAANALIMNTAVIQANAQAGTGGDIGMNINTLIPSQESLIKGGVPVFWKPNAGFNVIQAASAIGVSGNINLTSPQFSISGTIKLFDEPPKRPNLNQSFCQEAASESSFVSLGKGGKLITDAKQVFIAPIKLPKSSANFESLRNDEEAITAMQINNQSCTAK